MMLFKISLLNIRKHLKRSMLIMASVLISVIVMQFVSGMLAGIKNNAFNKLLNESGHLQIYEENYPDRLNTFSIEYLISSPDEIISELKNMENVAAAEKILQFGAQLINNEKNMNMAGMGIQRDTEFFKNIEKNIVDGTFIRQGGILLSEKVARMLNLKLNDPVIVFTETSIKSPNYMEYEVCGIFNTGSSEIDDNFFFIGSDDAAYLLYLEDEASEIRVLLTDPDYAEEFKDNISEMLSGRGLTSSTWKELFGSFIMILGLMDFFMLIVDFIIIIVAATVITNAILMNVFERFREYGTMRAIGLKKRQLFFRIIQEGFIEGTIGSFLGTIAGVLIVLYFTENGLNIGEMTEAFKVGSGNTFYFALSGPHAFYNFIFGILIAVSGSVYAAMVSLKYKLIDIIRYV
jgi:putative ABC transport system permease protein